MDLHSLERPFLQYFRSKRLALFYDLFAVTKSLKVLDLGGTLFFWELARRYGLPVPRVTIVNLDKPRSPVPEYAEWLVGDALRLEFPDNHFDLVFSNSLIEHLGSWLMQERFASEVRRLAPRYFVQTPSRDFLLEPHFLTPCVHWLPKNVRRRAIRNFTIWGLLTRPSPEKCEALVEEISLLSKSDMARLFPESEVRIERLIGMPKSIVAFSGTGAGTL